jgi:hypothetical protein
MTIAWIKNRELNEMDKIAGWDQDENTVEYTDGNEETIRFRSESGFKKHIKSVFGHNQDYDCSCIGIQTGIKQKYWLQVDEDGNV